MLTLPELQRALTGAWLLAMRDPRAFEWFDLSVEGFWRSFYAALVAAPLYFFLAAHEYALTGLPADLFTVLFVRSAAYAVDWAAFPLVALFLTRAMGLGACYVAYIIANNWATVLQLALFTVAVAAASLLPEALGSIVVLVSLVAVLAYRWLVARQALATSGAIAAGFVVVDLMLGLTIDRLARGMLQI